MMQTLLTLDELKSWRQACSEQKVAFVPTMGALHQGHMQLIVEAKKAAERVIVSIFVNPLQFGPSEDFSKYPRTLSDDVEKLTALEVDAVFLPSNALMYPTPFQTTVHNSELAGILCGATRQGHFDGVLTVVLKLFQLVQPNIAFFGKKDYQQWRMIEQMAKDLNLPLAVEGVPTMREKDGLAMSSRNRYLSPQERALAPAIYQQLQACKSAFQQGEKQASVLLERFKEGLPSEIALEYIELRHAQTLQECSEVMEEPVTMLFAGRLGSTRLIDNIEF